MTDERLEIIVGRLLRTGVLISAAVVLAGGIWWLMGAAHRAPDYRQFRSEPRELRHITALAGSLAHPTPEIVSQWGLLLLIATPVARVALALVAFALEHDRAYVLITLVVLLVLLYSLASPTAGG